MIKPWPKHPTQPSSPRPAGEPAPRIFRLSSERLVSPRTGASLDATIVEAPDWVNVIALTPDAQVVLVRQYRFGSQTLTLEIPGGAVDPGESPLAAAQRELREETGYTAARWQSLGHVWPNPAFLRNRLHGFVALGCQPTAEPQLDPFEDIEVQCLPLPEVEAALLGGEIDHALVLALFMRFELSRRDGRLDLEQAQGS